MKNQNKTLIILFILLVSAVVFQIIQTRPHDSSVSYAQDSVAEKRDLLSDIDNKIKIDYNFPIPLSGKSKKEICDIRKSYVSKSIFSAGKYEPSEQVFGQIVSGKPWIALNICSNKGISKTQGPSEEGRYINNPAILVSIEYPFVFDYDNHDWCTSKINTMIPKEISYDGTKKEITVVYYKLPFITHEFDFYNFNGINARDLGYSYAFVDLSKSSFKPKFINSDNVSNNIAQFVNFIHLGSSCGVDGGCNNGSPRQPAFEFIYTNQTPSNSNGEIYIKLWKNKPNSKNDAADIVEKIVIENY